MRMKRLVMMFFLVVTTTFANSSFAALLGVQPGLPQISFNIGSTTPATSYDPATGLFSVTASPLSYRWSTTVAPVSVTGTKSLTLKVHLDSTGKMIPNVEGDELVVTGTITAAGQTYSGTLLTGKVTAFGFFNSATTTDSFDFRLTTTGGVLQSQWAGKDIGITLASENSTFAGNFAVSFRGNAKGTIGTIPGPYMTLTESCTDAKGQEPIQISATLTNTGTESLKNITCTSTPDAALTGVPTSDLAPGASVTITGSYLPASSPSTGTISCSGTGSGSQITISTSSSATCGVVVTPAFSVSATCADAPAPGRPMAISATITNTGNESLTGFSCSDSMGSTLSGVPSTLAPGAAAVLTGSYLPSSSGSADTITCSARGAFDGAAVSGTSGATCNIVTNPALSVAESCTDAPAPGQPIALAAILTNTGNETLSAVKCTDSNGAPLSGVPATLAPGATASITGSYLPTASGSVDSITCTATGAINSGAVSANSSSTCNIVTKPAIAVSESCTDAPAPGQPISLSAVLTNTGNEPLNGVACSDSRGAAIAGVPATLAPGATASLTASYLPTASGSTDTITCSATGAINSGAVSSNSSSTCNIVTKPAIAVSESCTDAPAPGQPISLSAVLTNTGNEPLGGIICSDSRGAAIAGVPATLQPGATVSLTASYIPTASGSADTITCSATGAINSGAVSGNSSSTCNIVTSLAMAVSESCTDASAPGQPINLSAVLTNLGNEPLVGIACSDSRGATIAGVPATLAPGATASLSASYVPTASGSTDTISCTASGSINSGAVSANSSAVCNIITKPALAVAASCVDAPAPGQPIAVSATVSNTGNETLTAVTCRDSNGSILSGVPALLLPGASATFSGSYTPSASPSTDTITCAATGATNGAAVSGNSSATCSVLHPAIGIKKLTNGVDAPTGSGPQIPFGAPVTWTYIVTNTGNVTLFNVTVTDNKVSNVSCPQTTLAVGASMTCTATGTAIAGQYENIGTATGTSGGVTVTSSYPSHYYGNTGAGCTYTQGFWKNHPDKWPVTSLTLGTVSYTKDELLSILQTPVKGNGLISLAHQLIAAKLNVAGGGALTPEVQAALNSADALVGSQTVPPVGTGYIYPGDSSTLEGILDTYNSGLAANGPGHCGDVPALPCTGSIGNLVWKDLNANGIQDAGEPGIAGVVVTLTNMLTGETKTDTTDAGGYYMFTGLCAANYTVTAATPPGLLPSPANQGNNREADSNGSPAKVSLPTDSYNDNSVDFGFYQQSCSGVIGDLVWNDLNGNGIQDAGEPGMGGITLSLGNDATGVTMASTTTDANGLYRFSALCAGSYTITAAPPVGFTASPTAKSTDRAKDSNGSPAKVSLATNSSTDLTIDFGYHQPLTCNGSIGDLVWNDLNGNGIQDAGEPGIAGVAVTLTNVTTGATQSATTDASGHYLFGSLCAGSYQVAAQTPPAFSPSPAAQGNDSGKDSNDNPYALKIGGSTSDLSVDFGFYKTPTPGQATGCSLGYWKNHTKNWPAASQPTDNFDTVFGTNAFSHDITLLQALKMGGGDLAKLARQGTAALLNAEDARLTAFPLTVNDLKAAIQNAVATGAYEPLASQLDSYNNLGCPLN